jgi:hypothetical protein
MTRTPALAAIGLVCVACTAGHDNLGAQAATPAGGPSAGCLSTGGGFLHAQLRGAVVADLRWDNTQMQCEGSPRPDGHGLRVTFAGHLPTDGSTAPVGAPRQLRFIFGIDERDSAAGAARALPTNLTVILEGEGQLYATRGGEQCAVESLQREPLDAANSGKSRIRARGYCLGPATNVTGDARLLVPTFEFTGIADTELAP